jgi:PKD repeat protein
VSATVLTFTATGSDPQGATLTFTWQFGDGQTASGQSVTHVFEAAGSYNVLLTIRSAAGSSGTANGAVVARTITGSWIDNDPRFVLELTQTGPNFVGRVLVNGLHVSNIVNGTVLNPRAVTFRREWTGRGTFGVYTGDYVGSVDAALNRILANSIPGVDFTLTRQ